jgi:hypothetical protein
MFTVGSVCRVKQFSVSGKRFADDEEVETEVRKWLRWDKCISVGGEYVENFLFRFEYHMLYVLYPFVTHLLAPVLSLQPRLCLRRGLFPSVFPTKSLYTFLFFPMLPTYPAHLIPLEVVILI